MRRSRISIKPNVRSGNRTGTIGEQACEAVKEAGDPLPAGEDVVVSKPALSQEKPGTLNKPSENVSMIDVPGTPTGLNRNVGAPSSGASASSAAPSRRMRILATPKLGPKFTSTPRMQPISHARTSIVALAPIPNVPINNSGSQDQDSVSIISKDLPESESPRRSTSPTKLPTQSSGMTNTSSPCVPSTSGLQKATVLGKTSVEDCPSSPQPGQVPQQPSQEPEAGPACLSNSDLSTTCITPSQIDQTGSSEVTEKSSDRDRILRALKLKELMKIERRKDIQSRKKRVGHKEYTALDRSKMTMRDLIYYLPNTSPMRSSAEPKENQEDTIVPPSPRQQIKTAERDDEDEEESDNGEMLVPKVRVAEDGSIILDEESLTVRVKRTSNSKLLEDSMTMFERGSTTTYASFRTVNYVKSWSVRETDLFFLAISMVGTDFTLIGQLLSHRSRAAIKNKFRKEERLNPWRVDKALRNSRPYDKEFFSYLLEKILAKDKDKRKSVKLILPKSRKPRKSKGKASKEICISDDDADNDDIFSVDDYGDMADDADALVEKENEDVSNVKESTPSVPAKKRRKRTDKDKDKDKGNSTAKQVKRKRQRRCSKNTSEMHSQDDAEGVNNLSVEGDIISLDKEEDLERSTSASKKRRKRSKSSEEKQNENPTKEKKGKQRKKSRKVVSEHEESVSGHEEGSIADGDDSAVKKKKRKQAKNTDLNGDVPGRARKRKKAQKSIAEVEGNAGGEASLNLQDSTELNGPDTAEVAVSAPPKTTKRGRKPNLAATRKKKSKEPAAAPEVESQFDHHESILTAASSPVQDERLGMQAVVVLEKTPPRQLNSLSPYKAHCKDKDLAPLMSSAASSSECCSTPQTRKQRAGRVKRDLSTSGTLKSRERMIDEDQAEALNPLVLLEQIIQESEDEEQDNSVNENLLDLSCLHGVDSQMFQRKPMVVLSREEVDMVLHPPDQSDEDPSVSPLDLSLNTELSFPFQCSKLMEDDEEAEVEDCVYDERSNEQASCEERTCGDLELKESALAQPNISNVRDIPSCLKPEVCSDPEASVNKVTGSCITEEDEPQVHPVACKDGKTIATIIEGSSTPIILDNVDPICTNPDEPLSQETPAAETITFGTSLAVSNVIEESEKYVLPTSPNESALASSEIPPQSKVALIESEPLQAAEGLKEDLQPSPEGQTLRDLSESKKGLQESVMASPEEKVRRIAPEVKQGVSDQTRSASDSSELCIRPAKRSRILKPRPNLSQKSRGSALPCQRRGLKTVSTEKLLRNPATHQPDAFEDIGTHENETSRSHAVDQMESVTDLSDSSPADLQCVTAGTLNPASTDEPQVECSSSKFDVGNTSHCTPLTLPQRPETREDPGMGQRIVPSQDVCAPAEILHLTQDGHGEEPTFILTLYEIPVTQTFPLSSSNGSAMTRDLPTVERLDSTSVDGSGAEKDNLQQDLCLITKDLSESSKEQIVANATSHEMISPQIKEEDAANLNLGSLPRSDCEKSSEIAPFDLADRIQSKPSGFSGAKCSTALPQDSGDTEQSDEAFHMVLGEVFVPVSEGTEDDASKDGKIAMESKLQRKEASLRDVAEYIAVNVTDQRASCEHKLSDKKDEESDAGTNLKIGIPNMEINSECERSSTSTPLEDVESGIQGIPSEFFPSQCITRLSGDSVDTMQHEKASHVILGDVFVPVLEDTGDEPRKEQTKAVECKPEHEEGSSDTATEDLAENVKEQIFEHMTFQEPVLEDTNYEDRDVCLDVETPHMDPRSESKMGLDINPVEASNIPLGSECIETLPQESPDTAQSEKVSHLVLDDLVAPVSEEGRDISVKDGMMDGENKFPSKDDCIVGLPERQDTQFEALTKVADLSAVSNPLLCLASTEESKDTPRLSGTIKAPARRRERQIKPQPKLVKRSRAKAESSKTEERVKEMILPTTSQDGNTSTVSHTPEEKSVESISSIEGNISSVSRGKDIKHKSTPEESLKMSQGNLGSAESKHMSSALQLSMGPNPEEESSENVIEDVNKDDTELSAENKGSSTVMPGERAIVQPCCDNRNSSVTKASGSDSSDVNCEKAEAGNVSHMLLPDVFVLVSDETEIDLCSDWSVGSSLQRDRAGDHFHKELKTEDVSQSLMGESSQLPLTDIDSPVKKRAAASQPTTLPPNENMVLLEGQLQTKHHIMPCSVRLSSIDISALNLTTPQNDDRNSHNKNSPNVANISEASCTPSLCEEMKLEEPALEKKFPSGCKGERNESSADTNPVRSISRTQQLTITDWVKEKTPQAAANQEEKDHTRLQVKDVHQLMVDKTPSTSTHTEETESSHLPPSMDEDKETKRSSEVGKESTEDLSVVQVRKSPVRRRAKLQVKPILTKRARVKSDASTSDQPQPSRLNSPTPPHALAAREKEESDNKAMRPVKEDLNRSRTEADSASTESSVISGSPVGIYRDKWPRVVLPRVKLCTREAGICSASSTPTSSPARVSQSASPSVTPPQPKESPTQSGSPAANENPDDDPSRVSQFFLCDIFTEVDE